MGVLERFPEAANGRQTVHQRCEDSAHLTTAPRKPRSALAPSEKHRNRITSYAAFRRQNAPTDDRTNRLACKASLGDQRDPLPPDLVQGSSSAPELCDARIPPLIFDRFSFPLRKLIPVKVVSRPTVRRSNGEKRLEVTRVFALSNRTGPFDHPPSCRPPHPPEHRACELGFDEPDHRPEEREEVSCGPGPDPSAFADAEDSETAGAFDVVGDAGCGVDEGSDAAEGDDGSWRGS